MRKRFKLTDRDVIISLALHEAVHAIGCGTHDERYANLLTDKLAIVMAGRKKFNNCF
jgi:hypothetical protein